MRYPTHPRTLVGLSLAAAALLVAAPAAAETPEFEVLVLPPVEVDGFSDSSTLVWDLNNAGQVAGNNGFAAFRFTPPDGIDIIQAGRRSHELARGINDRGDVLVWDFARNRWYLYSDEAGLERLDRGLTGRQQKTLFVFDLNNRGDLVGATAIGRSAIPVLYTPEDGWRDLSGLDPRFEKSTFGKWINDARDVVLTVSRPPAAGADPPYARQQTFVLEGGIKLVEIEDPASGVNVPGDLNESGEFAGLFIDDEGRSRTFIFRPGVGVDRVRTGNFKATAGNHITEDGIVGGMGRKKKGLDSLFWVDPAPGGERGTVNRREFKRLVRSAGSKRFVKIALEAMNDRVEFVGWARAKSPTRSIPFFYSRAAGLHSIQSILDAAGADFTVATVVDLNDRGQILIDGKLPDGSFTGAILTPRE